MMTRDRKPNSMTCRDYHACRRATLASLLLSWVCLVLLPAPARAEMTSLDDGGAFDVRSAYLEPKDHTYHLNASLDIALSKSAEQPVALASGPRVDGDHSPPQFR